MSNPVFIRVLTIITAASIAATIANIAGVFVVGGGPVFEFLNASAKYTVYAMGGLSFITVIIGWKHSRAARIVGIIGLVLLAILFVAVQMFLSALHEWGQGSNGSPYRP